MRRPPESLIREARRLVRQAQRGDGISIGLLRKAVRQEREVISAARFAGHLSRTIRYDRLKNATKAAKRHFTPACKAHEMPTDTEMQVYCAANPLFAELRALLCRADYPTEMLNALGMDEAGPCESEVEDYAKLHPEHAAACATLKVKLAAFRAEVARLVSLQEKLEPGDWLLDALAGSKTTVRDIQHFRADYRALKRRPDAQRKAAKGALAALERSRGRMWKSKQK